MTDPDATSEANVSVVDTCQSTSTSALAIPPWPSAFVGDGASRVHSTTLSGAGSPDAIPSVNGYGVTVAARRTVPRTEGDRAGRCGGSENEGSTTESSADSIHVESLKLIDVYLQTIGQTRDDT